MLDQEVQRLAALIDAQTPKNEAYLAIRQYGGGFDECFIEGNAHGLRLLAAQLLTASLVSDAHARDGTAITWSDTDQWWHEGDVFIDHVQPVDVPPEIPRRTTTWKDRIAGFGCFLFALTVVGLMLIGGVAVLFLLLDLWRHSIGAYPFLSGGRGID